MCFLSSPWLDPVKIAKVCEIHIITFSLVSALVESSIFAECNHGEMRESAFFTVKVTSLTPLPSTLKNTKKC